MQKVEGSSPFIRSESPWKSAGAVVRAVKRCAPRGKVCPCHRGGTPEVGATPTASTADATTSLWHARPVVAKESRSRLALCIPDATGATGLEPATSRVTGIQAVPLPAPVGEHGEHAAVVLGRLTDPEFREGASDVRLDGLRTKPQLMTDALVGAAFGH